MSRDLAIGNGSILIAFDRDAILREFYFPYVGQENHTKGERFRFGIWLDGDFRWIPNGFEVERHYLDDTLVTDVLFRGMGVKIRVNDLVDYEKNLYLKKISVENELDYQREARLFLAHDFHLYGNEIGDTAAFKPEQNCLIHYKDERYFLINILANNKFGIDSFATGSKEKGEGLLGTWKDAEDGVLSLNPIAQGSVDSVVGIPMTLPPKGKESCYYWIGAGKTWKEVSALDLFIKKRTPEKIFKRTHDFWKLWVLRESPNPKLLPEKVLWLYKRSLLICRTQINNCGSIIAGNDSDSVDFNSDTYSYMWPRDGALVAYGLDLAGYDITRSFYQFCAKILTEDGYFLHKYTPSGALASSWHPWIKDKKAQLPIQEDETALVLWALWNHYKIFKDLELIKTLYNPFIRKMADFMMNYRDSKTGLPLPSFDLWEERQGVLTFTVSAVYGGLMSAANFADLFGEAELAEEYRQGAEKMRRAMDDYLYLKKEKRFARMVRFNRDGSYEIDAGLDASLYGIFAFGAYDANDEKVKSTMGQIRDKLWVKTDGGGLCRYENDPYYAQGGESNPWFITTLWMAQYEIAKAKSLSDLKGALEILEWVADRALPSGTLAEQINPNTLEPLSVSPLTWSHGSYIIAIQEYLNKLLEIDKCPTCGMPKFRKCAGTP